MPVAQLTAAARGTTVSLQVPTGIWQTLGRSGSCDLQVKDDTISRTHCRLYCDGSRLVVQDEGSAHGVLRNGSKVARCTLEVGDSCQLGHVVLQFTGVYADKPTVVAPAAAAAGMPEPPPAAAGPASPAPTPTQDPRLGRHLGGYEILARLGKGGSATVYRARQHNLQREVALKVLDLPTDPASHDRHIAGFLREARAAAALNHPNLVQVYDVGSDAGEHFFAMELATGGSLAARIRKDGPLAWAELEPIARDLAAALRCIHERGIVHKDVKPANVLLGSDGRAKLGDLGIAGSDERAGTLAFIAPEQLRGQPVDAAADLYAFGCTLYAALCGEPPFRGDPKAIAKGHLKGAVVPLHERGAIVPVWLDELIVDDLLAKDPAQRPASAAAFVAQLDAARAAATSPRRIVRRRSRVKSFAAMMTAQTIVFLIVLVMAIVALLAAKLQWPEWDLYKLLDWVKPNRTG